MSISTIFSRKKSMEKVIILIVPRIFTREEINFFYIFFVKTYEAFPFNAYRFHDFFYLCREQLENYEVERNALVAQKKEAQGQVEDLASKYAQLLGHQNHKQKIHHLVKLKQDNLDLRTELAKVNLDLNKQKRLVARYKGSKENSHPDLLKTPMSAMKTPNIRRQTIASPLSNRNGQR